MIRIYAKIIFSFIFCIASSGCIFAPSTYGSRGIAYPGDVQYDKYLANCRERYDVLNSCCEKWGNPVAIQIGHSGGYFVWKENRNWVRVKSFGATVHRDRHPKALIKDVFGNKGIAGVNNQSISTAYNYDTTAKYIIETFERVSDNDFAYVFSLRLKDGANVGLSALNQIKKEIRQTVASDYIGAYGGNLAEVHVDLPEFSLKDDVIRGRADVIRISVVFLTYNPQSQKGMIAIKIGANRFEDARKWVRKNIESLARDKNVALTTGQIPAAARFYLGAERIKDGNILEIEFETE